MIPRRRCSPNQFLKIILACCVALVYLEFQLMPITKRNRLVDVLQLKKDESQPEMVQWKEICNPKQSSRNDKTGLQNDNSKENKTGNLNVLIWENIIGSSINSLLTQPMFPRQPSEVLLTSSAFVKLDSIYYGQWIVGYLQLDETGEFQFALSSDDSSELWLSTDESAGNARRIAKVGDGNSPGWTRLGHHTRYPNQISSPIKLRKCNKYFIEVIHKQSLGAGFVTVSWKRPAGERFHIITGTYLSPLFPSTTTSQVIQATGDQFENLKAAFERQRENKLSLELRSDYVDVGVLHSKLTNSVISTCLQGTYKVNPASQAIQKYITGVYPTSQKYKINLSKEPSNDDKLLKELHGKRGILTKKAAKAIVGRYLVFLEEAHPGKFSLESINKVEHKKYSNLGERYLLDLMLRDNLLKITLRTATYVYKSWAEDSLCMVGELQWSSNTLVQVIVIVEKAEHGKWVINMIDNMEDIYKRTTNNNIHLTVVNYGRKEFDLEKVLSASALPKHNVILRDDAFNHAKAVQKALNSLENEKSIAFLVDPHMKLPMDIFDQVRKHCFKKKMAFSPIAFHMIPGTSPSDPEGLWDYRGLTSLAMFKEDWKRVMQIIETDKFDKNENEWKAIERHVESIIEVERIKVDDLYLFREDEELVIKNNKNSIIIYT